MTSTHDKFALHYHWQRDLKRKVSGRTTFTEMRTHLATSRSFRSCQRNHRVNRTGAVSASQRTHAWCLTGSHLRLLHGNTLRSVYVRLFLVEYFSACTCWLILNVLLCAFALPLLTDEIFPRAVTIFSAFTSLHRACCVNNLGLMLSRRRHSNAGFSQRVQEPADGAVRVP